MAILRGQQAYEWITKSFTYFTPDEICCNCKSCSSDVRNNVVVETEHALRMDRLRAAIGKPLIVNSWHRCEKHNQSIGGSRESYHQKAMATDIRIPHGTKKSELISTMLILGFGGIGYDYDAFVHCDSRPIISTGNVMFFDSYGRRGEYVVEAKDAK